VGTALASKAVLVADDNADNAELLEVILGNEGADVRTAATAREVLALLATSWKPDALLLDISLPDMDGYALLETIRNEPLLHDVPAVAVTGRAYERDKQRAADAGFALHVTKPFDGEALVHVVARLTLKKAHEAPVVARELHEAIASGGVHAAIAVLNKRGAHRFTAIYRFDGKVLTNLHIFDRRNPTVAKGDDATMSDTYCSLVAATRKTFVTSDTLADPRLAEHPARLAVQSYCGVLLRNTDSTPFGSLCHFDLVPVAVTPETIELLELAAPLISAQVAHAGDY
jgi:CheY-like chemotaxis protein